MYDCLAWLPKGRTTNIRKWSGSLQGIVELCRLEVSNSMTWKDMVTMR